MSVREDENFDRTMDIKYYGDPNVDTTGMPPALADRVKKKPGRPPKLKAEPAAVDLKTHIEELRGKRAAEAAERKAMAEEIERLKAQLEEQQKENDALQMLHSEATEMVEALQKQAEAEGEEYGKRLLEIELLRNENIQLRKRLANAGRHVNLTEAKWKIWKDGELVADGLQLEDAKKAAGVGTRDLYRMRVHTMHWRALVEGDEGYDT